VNGAAGHGLPTFATVLGPAVDEASELRVGGPLELGIPVTDRLLRRLPGPRWALIALWAVGVLVTPFVLAGTKSLTGPSTEFNGLGELAPQAVLTYVVALLLHGVARLVDRATALRPDVERLTNDRCQANVSARGWDVAGPMGLSTVVVLIVSWSSWGVNGVIPTMAVLPFLALAVLPVMTFVWTYIRLLIGLDQLGRARLALEPFPQDRSLGLGVVGSLAFSGFAFLVAAAVPTMLATTRNASTFFIAAVILGVNIPILFLSMWRLHRQMSGAKTRYISEARLLYAAAYEPLRSGASLSVLRKQAPVLDAARALEERAERIQAWPISDGLIAIIGFIVAGVTSGMVVRLIVVAANF
jgi:hypothetical protein